MVLAGLGILTGLMVLLPVTVFTFEEFDIITSTLILEMVIDLLSKVGLFVFGLAMVLRARWVTIALFSGLFISMLDSFMAFYMIFASDYDDILQSNMVSDDASFQVWQYIAAALPMCISLAMYLGTFIYLKSEASRQEFGLK